MKYLIFVTIIFFKIYSFAFVDELFKKASSSISIAEGIDDVSDSINQTANFSDSINSYKKAIESTNRVIDEGKAAKYDLEYLSSNIRSSDDLAEYLHFHADKIRRAKRLAQKINSIIADSGAATALETIKTNENLEKMIAFQYEKEIKHQTKNRKLVQTKVTEEINFDRSLKNALKEIEIHQVKTKLTFSPFNVPNNIGTETKIKNIYNAIDL